MIDDLTIGMKVAEGQLDETDLRSLWDWFNHNHGRKDSVSWLVRGGDAMREYVIEQYGASYKALMEGPVTDTSYDGHPNPEYGKAIETLMIKQAQRVIDRLNKLDAQAGKAIKASLQVSGIDDIMLLAEGASWAEELIDLSRSSITEVVRLSAEASITVAQGISFDLANTRVVDFVDDSARRIGKQATDTFRTEIRGELLAGIEAGESTVQIAKRIEAIQGGDFVKWKANQIARTETAFAFTAGTIEGWKQSGVVIGKQFVLAPDACPWCQAIAAQFGDGKGSFEDNVTVPLDEPLIRKGGVLTADFDGKTRRMDIDYADMNGPPVHPHCRCSLRAVIQET